MCVLSLGIRMRVAMLITGRATRYEECLLPILERCKYDIDLFISINAEDCEYYKCMREKLNKWLKGVYIQPFIIPSDFNTEFIDDEKHCYQFINNKWLPRNQLSMYWNDRNAFEMACKYEYDNKFEYDYYMRFRADIINTELPILEKINNHELNIFTIYPHCMFESYGIHKRPIISSDWVWGNRKTMAIYCNTYDFVIKKNKEYENRYVFHFESNHTDCMVENNVHIEYVHIKYGVDRHRKVFDTNWKLNTNGHYSDSRKIHIPGAHEYISPESVTTLAHIPVEPE
jgi:hypothetical protein